MTMECKSIENIVERLQDALIVGRSGQHSLDIRNAMELKAQRLKRLQELGGMYSQIEMSPYAREILESPTKPSTVKSRIDELPAKSSLPSRALTYDVQ